LFAHLWQWFFFNSEGEREDNINTDPWHVVVSTVYGQTIYMDVRIRLNSQLQRVAKY
jgi:hypothetical protein